MSKTYFAQIIFHVWLIVCDGNQLNSYSSDRNRECQGATDRREQFMRELERREEDIREKREEERQKREDQERQKREDQEWQEAIPIRKQDMVENICIETVVELPGKTKPGYCIPTW